MQEATLDGMPPVKKTRVVKKKKFQPTKNVPVEVSIRRQLSGEIGDDEPTKDQKFVLLQKYGVTAPRIDRLVTKPNWMGVAEWKRKQNDWFKATKGMVNPSQRPRFNRPMSNSQPSQPGRPLSTRPSLPMKYAQVQTPSSRPPVKHTPWREIRHKNPNHPSNRPSTNQSRPNSDLTRTETPRS